jgi:hypothetical protein
MPKKALSQEEMEANYAAWKDSPEWQACAKFGTESANIDMNTSLADLCMPFQNMLDALFDLYPACKVPKKSKEYK